jgi:SAM-dependent methyltransferase
LLAQDGIVCSGVDPNRSLIELASQAVSNQAYANTKPQFTTMHDGTVIPLTNESCDTVLLFDCVERHHNPVALLGEAHRVLRNDGLAVFIVRERAEPFDADHDGLHAYRPHELVLQVQASWLFDPQAVEGLGSLSGAMILVAKRRAAGKQSFYPTHKNPVPVQL